MSTEKVKFKLHIPADIHSEMKNISQETGTSMTTFFITGGLREARNRKELLKQLNQLPPKTDQ